MFYGCINRGFLNQDQFDYEIYVDDSISVYGNGSILILLDLLGLLDNMLVDMVNDYLIVVRKLDFEDVDDMEVDVIVLIGFFLIWFDCIKDDFCIVLKVVFIKFFFLVVKLLYQDVLDLVVVVLKSRKICKFVFIEGWNYVVYDFEMDGVVFLLVDEKRKRRYVESFCFYQVYWFFNGM